MTSGKICDLCQTGAALLLDAPVRAGAILVAKLEEPPPGLEEPFLLRIKHVKTGKAGGWDAGCSFTRRLDDEMLRNLVRAGTGPHCEAARALGGGRDIRSSTREKLVSLLRLRLKPVNLLRPEVTARLQDRSRGGIGLVSLAAFPAGTVLHVRADHAESAPWVQVRVKYCRPQERQWLLGCQFTEPPSPAALAQFKG